MNQEVHNTDKAEIHDIAQPAPALLNIEEVAKILSCSSRHVRRLIDSRRMPRPIKLGSLTRWTRKEIVTWLNAGCPDCRKGVR